MDSTTENGTRNLWYYLLKRVLVRVAVSTRYEYESARRGFLVDFNVWRYEPERPTWPTLDPCHAALALNVWSLDALAPRVTRGWGLDLGWSCELNSMAGERGWPNARPKPGPPKVAR